MRAVKLARQYTDDVEFSAEDAVRSEIGFPVPRVRGGDRRPARRTINVPDTVGYSIPEQCGELLQQLLERIPNADKAIWSTHCHNDLGLAVANSLSAVLNGARQVECTINGLGERAGNASLEEIVMAVRTRRDVFPCRPASTPRRSCRPPSWCRPSPATRCSPTRRSSAPTPSRTSPASTRTACSSTARPTRSCAPRTWAGAPTAHARQAVRAQRLQDPPARSWASSSTPRKRSTPPSRASRNWPTRSARSSTRTCRRWSPTKASTPENERFKLVSLIAHSETGEQPLSRGW